MTRPLSRELSRELTRELSRELSRELTRELTRELSRELTRELSRALPGEIVEGAEEDLLCITLLRVCLSQAVFCFVFIIYWPT